MLGFKPKLLPTIFTIPALILLLGLSTWQFQRLHWKQGIIDKITEQSQLAPVDLPQKTDDIFYRSVILKGELLHEHELHMYGGNRRFEKSPDYYILTPMRLTDNRIVLVNRGWVPEKIKDANKRPETLVKGEVELVGSVMPVESKTLYIHDNQPNRNLWFYINMDEIKSFLNLPIISDFYILAKEEPNSLPHGRNLKPNLRNNHLGYALTWLFSAIALMVIYVLYHRGNHANKS